MSSSCVPSTSRVGYTSRKLFWMWCLYITNRSPTIGNSSRVWAVSINTNALASRMSCSWIIKSEMCQLCLQMYACLSLTLLFVFKQHYLFLILLCGNSSVSDRLSSQIIVSLCHVESACAHIIIICSLLSANIKINHSTYDTIFIWSIMLDSLKVGQGGKNSIQYNQLFRICIFIGSTA